MFVIMKKIVDFIYKVFCGKSNIRMSLDKYIGIEIKGFLLFGNGKGGIGFVGKSKIEILYP